MNIVPSVCCQDCGGSCPLNLYVEDGWIVKIEPHDVGMPATQPCVRGLLYHYLVYTLDRLKYPMKRAGERGEGKFVRISWDEALEEVGRQLYRVRDSYGPASILNLAWMGPCGRLHNLGPSTRFLNMLGGQTRLWGGTSHQGGAFTTLAMYGMPLNGNERADLLNSKFIILWGCNPASPTFGTETRTYLTKAREKGIKIVSIDPRFTETAATWASQWIPIRPGTDAAMMVAMAYHIFCHDLINKKFLETYTLGFNSFEDYFTGREDGICKTPEWAEKICGVPAQTIRNLAEEYAKSKPAALITGYAPGRSSRGEEYHRAAVTLSAMTGNIGIHGGSSACQDRNPSILAAQVKATRDHVDQYIDLPMFSNPVDENLPLHEYAVFGIRQHTIDKVHPSCVWDAILQGKAGGYFTDIKALYVAGGNPLNQFSDTNAGVKAMRKLDFIVVHEHFMTATACFADIVLPACTWAERNDFMLIRGHYAIFANKAIEPLYESKSDLDIFKILADKMGIKGYNDRTEDEWLREFAAKHGIPDYEAFKASGFYRFKHGEPKVAYQAQIEDPVKNPFATPSGRIEIYSRRIADFNKPDELPAVPKYLPGWEAVGDPLMEKYPLQLVTTHTRRRTHSQMDSVHWFRDQEPHQVWINPVDAAARKIKHGDKVKVFNDKGTLFIEVKITERIMPGVISIYEGTWYNPDEGGTDRGGCVNVLTRSEHSPGGCFAVNSILVEIEK